MAALAVLGACGDNRERPQGADDAGMDAATADAGQQIEIGELPVALTAAVCEWELRCGLWPDAASCTAAFDPAATDLPQLVAYVEAEKLVYSAEAAAACLTAFAAASCAATPTGLGLAPICDEVFTGDQIHGGACLLDEECAGDGVCTSTPCADGCCSGTCHARPAAAGLGSDCSAAPCADDATCVYASDGSASCVARAAPGEACELPDACAAGATCHAGECFALGARGDECDPAVAEGGGCAGLDDWCNPSSTTCEARISIGESCSADDQCVAAATCVDDMCVARPGLDGECGADRPRCLGDLECVVGTCSLAAAGTVCP